MMLGASSSSLIGNNNNSATGEAHGSGGDGEFGGGAAVSGGSFSDEDKAAGARIEGGGGGNRWPRQETLALLQIRSEMGLIFRDSNLKVPLWEEVSRKMSQLGYERSGKKCKEKFENVYKYHKRTKDSRAAKADGKSYRFFQQLEALESRPSSAPPLPPLVSTNTTIIPPRVEALEGKPLISPPPFFSNETVTSSSAISFSPNNNTNPNPNPMWSAIPPSHESHQPLSHTQHSTNTTNSQGIGITFPTSSQLMSDYLSSSSTSSDHHRRRHRKRKMREFFDTLMKDVIAKQEELQKRFLETLEKRERDRMIREEAWRVQEMARMNRELDLLAQERSKAAAKDVAMMAFLQKMTGQHSPPQSPPNNINVALAPPPPPPHQVQISLPELVSQQHTKPPPRSLLHSVSAPLPPPPAPSLSTPTLSASALTAVHTNTLPLGATTNTLALVPVRNDNIVVEMSSSRWPKAEVEALISLRTNIDVKYLDNNPKGPLWEDISAGMRKIGYNRSSKRCKEKWENINKYYKKVKESNKKRPEDSKTCPYFHQLDAIYREKSKTDPSASTTAAPYMITENKTVPLMVIPEQQWPLRQFQQESAAEDHDESDNIIDENDNMDDDGDGYEIVSNKQTITSMNLATSAAE